MHTQRPVHAQRQLHVLRLKKGQALQVQPSLCAAHEMGMGPEWHIEEFK